MSINAQPTLLAPPDKPPPVSIRMRERITNRHLPGDLWIAARWVLRTRDQYLRAAVAFHNGDVLHPLRYERGMDGVWRVLDTRANGGPSRVFEVAAAISVLESSHLDRAVLVALRETPWVDSRVAFAALAMGMSAVEARNHAESDTFPDLDLMLNLAALRGVDLTSIHDIPIP